MAAWSAEAVDIKERQQKRHQKEGNFPLHFATFNVPKLFERIYLYYNGPSLSSLMSFA